MQRQREGKKYGETKSEKEMQRWGQIGLRISFSQCHMKVSPPLEKE